MNLIRWKNKRAGIQYRSKNEFQGKGTRNRKWFDRKIISNIDWKSDILLSSSHEDWITMFHFSIVLLSLKMITKKWNKILNIFIYIYISREIFWYILWCTNCKLKVKSDRKTISALSLKLLHSSTFTNLTLLYRQILIRDTFKKMNYTTHKIKSN